MGSMTTMLSQKTAPLTPEAVQLLTESVKSQPESSLNSLDLCDRCRKGAKASFLLSGNETPLLLCAHHMRRFLPKLMTLNLTSFWISPEDLWIVKGLAPAQTHTRTGDGLTDS